jgi:hypothetical protein
MYLVGITALTASIAAWGELASIDFAAERLQARSDAFVL